MQLEMGNQDCVSAALRANVIGLRQETRGILHSSQET